MSQAQKCRNFFSSIGCKFGIGCIFSHERPWCRNYNTPAGCHFGDRCIFAHPPPQSQQCRNYNTAAGCKFGAKCQFSHKPVPVQQLPMPVQQLPKPVQQLPKPVPEPAQQNFSPSDLQAIADGYFNCDETLHALVTVPDPHCFCQSSACRKRIEYLAPFVKPRVRVPTVDALPRTVICRHGLGEHTDRIDCIKDGEVMCRSYFSPFNQQTDQVEESRCAQTELDEAGV